MTKPDETTTEALGAILTIVTFAAGFWSARLHQAFRDSLQRERELAKLIIASKQSGDPFPQQEVEHQYEQLGNELRNQFPGLFLAATALLTLAGLTLAGFTVWRNALRPTLEKAAEPLWGIAVLALGLIVVLLLSVLDYLYLRRLLRVALRDSLVDQVHRLERTLMEGWRLHAMVIDTGTEASTAHYAAEYGRAAWQSSHADVARARQAGRIGAWQSWVLAGPFCGLRRLAWKSRRAAKRAEWRRSRASARAQRALPSIVEQSKDLMSDLAERSELTHWGHLAGLRALQMLVEHFEPVLNRWIVSSDSWDEIEKNLDLAMAAEPGGFRWLEARALVAEQRGDFMGAARLAVRASESVAGSVTPPRRRRKRPLSTDLYGVARARFLVLSPQEVETHRRAVENLRAAGRLTEGPAFFLIVDLFRAVCREGAQPSLSADEWRAMSTDVIAAVTEYVQSHVGADEVHGWRLSRSLLEQCRRDVSKVLLRDRRSRLLEELETVDRALVEPAYRRWEAWLRPSQSGPAA